jgi:hypothetical protein
VAARVSAFPASQKKICSTNPPADFGNIPIGHEIPPGGAIGAYPETIPGSTLDRP